MEDRQGLERLPPARNAIIKACSDDFAMVGTAALFINNVDEVGGGPIPLSVPRPGFIEDDQAFFLFCVAMLAVVGTLVLLVRRGTTGKFLDALRGSETALAAIGISSARSRVLAFALSAGIAGFGGGLLAMLDNQANYAANYTPFFGLVWINQPRPHDQPHSRDTAKNKSRAP